MAMSSATAPVSLAPAAPPAPGELGNLTPEQQDKVTQFKSATAEDRKWHAAVLEANDDKLLSTPLAQTNDANRPLLVSIQGMTRQQLATERALDFEYETLRFLRAHKFHLDKAVENYHDFITWRREKNIDQLLLDYPPKLELLHRIVPSNLHGRDRNGFPAYIEKSGMINPAALLSLLTIDEVLTAHIWCQEMQVFRCKEFYRQTGRYLEKFANILDLKGFHLEQRRGLKFTKSITALDARMYPERMAVMYIINAPRIFSTIWSLIKGWIDPVTGQKIHIVTSAKCNETLLKSFAPDQLPAEYGGTCATCATSPDCIPLCDTSAIIASLPFAQTLRDAPHTQCNVGAGKSITQTLEVAKGRTACWSLSSGGYEIVFGAVFHPKAGGEAVTVIESEKSSPGKVPIQGSYTCDADGTITFTVGNSFSWMTSKNVDYCFTSFQAAESDTHEIVTQ